jgi:MFS family permease
VIRRSDQWPAYVAIATVGYALYSLGALGPYLRERLDLTEVQVGAHSSALAIGLLTAGFIAARVGKEIGEIAVRAAALALIAIALVTIAWAPTVWSTLAAALAIGLGAGTVLGYANATLSEPGGSLARLRLGRANVWAMTAAFLASLLLAFGAGAAAGWWSWLVPALLLVGIDTVDLAAGPRLRVEERSKNRGLPRAFWLAWLYVLSVVALESCVVFWGATLVARRCGLSTESATAVGTMFFAGMFAGRVGLSAGLGTTGDVRRPIAVGLLLAIAGAATAWFSTVPVLSAVGLFVTGVGIATLYPLGVSAALGMAPAQLAHGGARLTLATGAAFLVAPLALGAVADLSGVTAAWSLVLILAVAALGLTRFLRPTDGADPRMPETPRFTNEQGVSLRGD